MTELLPLPPEVEEKLYEEGDLGRQAWEAGDLARAEAHFLAGWECIPEPRLEYDFAAVIAVSLTQFYRDTGQAGKAAQWLLVAREGYGPGPNPHTEFLAATVHYEAGEPELAFAIFDTLYRQYRKRPFEGEKPEYLDFYLNKAAAAG